MPVCPRYCFWMVCLYFVCRSLQGEHFGTTEATEAFFAMTRLFQSNDVSAVWLPAGCVTSLTLWRSCVPANVKAETFSEHYCNVAQSECPGGGGIFLMATLGVLTANPAEDVLPDYKGNGQHLWGCHHCDQQVRMRKRFWLDCPQV